MWRVRLVLRLIGISLFFALALVPMVDAIAAKIRVPRAMIILGVYLVLIAGVAPIGYVVVPSFVVGLFDLIPLVGATLGAIFVALATLTVSFPAATIVWVMFIIVWQRFEDYVIQPLVYRRALRVNPIVTIVSVLAGASFARDPWRAAGHPHRSGDPDRAAQLVGQPHPRTAGSRVVTGRGSPEPL